MSLKPEWLKTPIPSGANFFAIREDLRERKLATVCEEAKCPNIGECWATNTATFMLMGDTCTRACRFCHIKTASHPPPINPDEAKHVAESIGRMRLKYVVMTMVNRDDMVDGGAQHVAYVVQTVQETYPGIIVEALVGDFLENETSIRLVAESGVQVYAHNLETVERLSPRVRDARATYRGSLRTLERAKTLGPSHMFTKSAIMLGLGETKEEVMTALSDLRSVGVEFVTLGQYMRPTKRHLAVKEWVHPDVFREFGEHAKELGFISVASAPLVRSSYRAHEFYRRALEARVP
jgi:lipoic acid synthetase